MAKKMIDIEAIEGMIKTTGCSVNDAVFKTELNRKYSHDIAYKAGWLDGMRNAALELKKTYLEALKAAGPHPSDNSDND